MNMTTTRVEDRSLGLGIDVGGTKVALGLVTVDGTLLSTAHVYNREAGNAAQLLTLVASAARQLAHVGGPNRLVGVGLGMPEVVDLERNIRTASVVPWQREAIETELSELGPVVVEADVRAAAIAEAQVGAGRPYTRFCYVTIGTGISYTLVRDHRPDAGTHGAAQSLGTGRIAVRCPKCSSLSGVVLEDVTSGPAIVAHFNQRTGHQFKGTEEVVAAAEAGDQAALEILEESAHIAGSFVAFMVNLVDPEAVVVGGGLGCSGGLWWDHLVRSIRDHIWPDYIKDISICTAALGPWAGVVGAGLCAIQELTSVQA